MTSNVKSSLHCFIHIFQPSVFLAILLSTGLSLKAKIFGNLNVGLAARGLGLVLET